MNRLFPVLLLLAACAPERPIPTAWRPEVPESPSTCVTLTGPQDGELRLTEDPATLEPLVTEFVLASACRLPHEVFDVRPSVRGGWTFDPHDLGDVLEPGAIHTFVAEESSTRVGPRIVGLGIRLRDAEDQGGNGLFELSASASFPVEGPLLRPRDGGLGRLPDTDPACWSDALKIAFINDGSVEAPVEGVTFVAGGSLNTADVELLDPEGLPTRVAPGATLNLHVAMRPHDEGWASATLHLDTPLDADALGGLHQLDLGVQATERPVHTVFVDPGPDLDTDALRILLPEPADPDSLEVRQGTRLRTDWVYEPEANSVRLTSFLGLPAEIRVHYLPTTCP